MCPSRYSAYWLTIPARKGLEKSSYASPNDVDDYWRVHFIIHVFVGKIGLLYSVWTLCYIASSAMDLAVMMMILSPNTLVQATKPLHDLLTRLDRARLDEQLSPWLQTRRARLTKAWLQFVSTNLAHRQGQPKRWYHYRPRKFYSDLPVFGFRDPWVFSEAYQESVEPFAHIDQEHDPSYRTT